MVFLEKEDMIQETVTYPCTRCGSINIVKNGKNRFGKQQYHCKDCGACRTLNPEIRYTGEEKERILRAYQERASMRGIERIFGVTRPTLIAWIKKKSTGYLL